MMFCNIQDCRPSRSLNGRLMMIIMNMMMKKMLSIARSVVPKMKLILHSAMSAALN